MQEDVEAGGDVEVGFLQGAGEGEHEGDVVVLGYGDGGGDGDGSGWGNQRVGGNPT